MPLPSDHREPAPAAAPACAEEFERLTRELEIARAACRAKSELLARVSHEIRTPLTAILGFADLLADDGQRDPLQPSAHDRCHSINTIRCAGRHVLTLVNDLLDHAKIDAGRMTVETIETPLVQIVAEVESLMLPRATSKGLRFSARLVTPVPDRIMGDPTRLRQMLVNIVGNAVKFTQRGEVSLSVSLMPPADTPAHEQRIRIDIRDTGPGLTDAQAANLFAPFAQADASTARTHGGTGLGLAISRHLARLMRGDISLASSNPGAGSCFRIELPCSPAANSRVVATLAAPPDAATLPASPVITLSGRILLAEDGPDNQRLIAQHLRKAGAEVTVAENGRVALKAIARAHAAGKPFDLLLTDMQMPVMDGYELARVLRRQGSRLPIVALTAHAMADDRARCLAAGCDDYARKPIDRAALLETCARWVGKRSAPTGAAVNLAA